MKVSKLFFYPGVKSAFSALCISYKCFFLLVSGFVHSVQDIAFRISAPLTLSSSFEFYFLFFVHYEVSQKYNTNKKIQLMQTDSGDVFKLSSIYLVFHFSSPKRILLFKKYIKLRELTHINVCFRRLFICKEFKSS